jgi:hypothetical protein
MNRVEASRAAGGCRLAARTVPRMSTVIGLGAAVGDVVVGMRGVGGQGAIVEPVAADIGEFGAGAMGVWR